MLFHFILANMYEPLEHLWNVSALRKNHKESFLEFLVSFHNAFSYKCKDLGCLLGTTQ